MLCVSAAVNLVLTTYTLWTMSLTSICPSRLKLVLKLHMLLVTPRLMLLVHP